MEIPFPCCLTWLHWMHPGIKQQNKTALYDQPDRGATSFFVSCCASCYRVLNVPTQHLKAEGSLFCLWFKLAGGEPAPIWRQCKLFSSKWCQTLVNTMLLCLQVLFFLLGFWAAWSSWGVTFSAVHDITVLFITYAIFFFGEQWVEILLRNFKALHFFCSTHMLKPICCLELLTAVNDFDFFCVQLFCYCSNGVWRKTKVKNLQFRKFLANFKIGKSTPEILYLCCYHLIDIPPCELGTQKTREVLWKFMYVAC